MTLRVAMLIQAYHPRIGGAERQLAAVSTRLQARGVEVHVLTRRYPGLKPFEVIGGVPVHRLPIPGPKPVAALAFTGLALPVLRKLRPQVLHAHELLSPATTALAAKRLFDIPVAAKVLRGGQLGDIAKLKSRPLGRQRLAALRDQIDAFIVISREIEAELAEIGVPPDKRYFIPNGVDIDRFCPAADKAARRAALGLTGEPLVIFTGRLSPEKCLDQLLSVWPAVRAAHPQAGLVLVGEGEQAGALQRLASAGVQFAGGVANVALYLQAADVFVLPSATEGLSNALLEALAVGLPVVATTVGGNSDVVETGRSGRLVPPNNPPALQAALVAALAQPAPGQAGRELIVREYALDRVADHLLALYERLTQV